jgi:hypothetical protein
VPTLDPWIAKLNPDLRAIMIEGPSRESIEIIGK